jgi:hypothetical protein
VLQASYKLCINTYSICIANLLFKQVKVNVNKSSLTLIIHLSSTGYSASTRHVICVSKGPPREDASINQSVFTGSRTIITRVFAYGKSQVKLSSQTETQQAGCKVAQREPSMQVAYFSCVRVRN